MKTLFLLLASPALLGASIKDYDFYKYDVAFTNPVCKEYFYEDTMVANNGEYLRSKPKNAYCKKSDLQVNIKRKASPHYKLKALIQNKDVKELFLTFLSFSNKDITKSLCSAVKKGVKVTFLIDSKNLEREYGAKQLNALKDCETETNKVTIGFKGNKGGLGYAHNKIIMADYKSEPLKTTLVFSSGNMSSGTVLHHENWHFLTTSKETHIYQAHACVRDAMLNEKASSRKKFFKEYLAKCRAEIKTPVESDIKTYFVPSDGAIAMKNIVDHIKASERVEVAVHRFTHKDLINALISKRKNVKFIADDDIYWAGQVRDTVGSNMVFEYYNVQKIERSGAEVRYVESNQGHRLLHHNKYVIFYLKNGDRAVHFGAGNFTKAAFSKNYENYYFVTIPEVLDAFEAQYKHMFETVATKKSELPKEQVLP